MARQRLRSHLTGSLPVSIVVHLVVLMVLVVIPLANIVLPIPIVNADPYVKAAPMPPPPPVVVQSRAAAAPVTTQPSNGAPTTPPETIRPELASTPQFATIDPIDGALPAGLGVVGSVAPPVAPSAPEPPKPQSGPVRAAQLPELPRKTVDVRPLYPEVARLAHIEGTVVLEAVLDTSGRVTQLKVIKSVSLLDQAALEAVRQWRYTPSLYGGRPVSVLMTVTVRFTLQQ